MKPKWADQLPFAGDPVGILLDRLGLSAPVRIALLCLTLQIITAAAECIHAAASNGWNALYHLSGAPGTLKFVAVMFFNLVISPIAWGFYAWISLSPGRTLDALDDRGVVLVTNEETHREAVGRFHSRFGRVWWFVASAVIAAGGVIYALGYRWAAAVDRPYVVLALPSWVLGWYMMSMIGFRELVMLVTLPRFFHRGQLSLQPFHQDDVGGLGPLSQYALRFTYLLALCAFGLLLVLYCSGQDLPLGKDPMLVVALFLYAVFAPSFFIGTLLVAHGYMKAARDKACATLAGPFNDLFGVVSDAISVGQWPARENIERIRELRQLQELTRRFPVWPVSARTVRRFSVVVLSPLTALGADTIATGLEDVVRTLLS